MSNDGVERDPLTVAETLAHETWSARAQDWLSDAALYDAVGIDVRHAVEHLVEAINIVAELRDNQMFGDHHYHQIAAVYDLLGRKLSYANDI